MFGRKVTLGKGPSHDIVWRVHGCTTVTTLVTIDNNLDHLTKVVSTFQVSLLQSYCTLWDKVLVHSPPSLERFLEVEPMERNSLTQ
jgi:hypothetical protein